MFFKPLIYMKNLLLLAKNTFYVAFVIHGSDLANATQKNHTKQIKAKILLDEFNKNGYEKTLLYDGNLPLENMDKFSCAALDNQIILIKTSKGDNFDEMKKIYTKIIIFYLCLFLINTFFAYSFFILTYSSLVFGILLVNSILNFRILKKQIRFLNDIELENF